MWDGIAADTVLVPGGLVVLPISQSRRVIHMREQITPAFHLSYLATWQEERELDDDRASVVEVYNHSSVGDQL